MKDKQACRHHNGEAVKHSRGASHCVITVCQTDMKKIFPEVVLMHPNEEKKKKHKENLFLMFYCEFHTAQSFFIIGSFLIFASSLAACC